MHHSARVEAVKAFASTAKDPKWKKVSEMPDIDIYNVVKHTQSENGAVRKIARMIQSDEGANLEFHAPTQTTAQAEAERKLLETVGVADVGAGANPYDNPQGHAGHAPEIRPQTARDAVRGRTGRGRDLDHDLQSEPGTDKEVKEAVEPKSASKSGGSSGSKATATA